LKKSLADGFEDRIVAVVERQLDLDRAVIVEFGGSRTWVAGATATALRARRWAKTSGVLPMLDGAAGSATLASAVADQSVMEPSHDEYPPDRL
jgi:hypothetical protein